MQRSLRRRRHEHKTDYKARLALLESGKPRIVVRKSNRYILVQAVTTSGAQDRVIASITSKALLKKGWPAANAASLKSLPAAYLIGFLFAQQLKGKCEEALFDTGMHRNIHKSRLYAVLKGLLDAGLRVPHSDEALPSEEDLQRTPHLRDILAEIRQSTNHGRERNKE